MPTTDGTKCRSCGAPIFFAPTEKSASVPFDAVPTHIYGMAESGKMKHLGRGHVCHFVTCPSREQHKKPAPAPAAPPAPAPQAKPASNVDRTAPPGTAKGKPKSPPARDYRDTNPPFESVFGEREE